MVSVACFKCNTELSNEALFCKKCGTQVKCKICETTFEVDATFCTTCGTEVTRRNNNINRAVNQIEFSQKGTSKDFKATFTDEVGIFLAGAFNTVVTGQSISPKNPFHKALQTSSSKVDIANVPGIKTNAANFQEAEVVDVNYSEVISRIFKQSEEGKLELIDNRLKEKSQRDKMKRLTILFMFAKKLMEIELVSRQELNDIIGSEKLGGGTFRKFLSKEATKYLSAKDNSNFTLLAGGEEEAKKILDEIADSNFKVTTAKSGRKPGKKSATDASNANLKEEAKSTNNSNPSALEMCKVLLSENYFSLKRKLSDVVKYCEEKRATKYSSQNLQNAANRLVKDQILDRGKNSDGQYEYWKK